MCDGGRKVSKIETKNEGAFQGKEREKLEGVNSLRLPGISLGIGGQESKERKKQN